MTGCYANRTGAYKNGTYVYERGPQYLEDHHGFGKLLRDAGYATAIAGKWHAGAIEPYEKVPGGYEFDGQSLVPFLTGKSQTHRDWIYGYIFSSQLLRTQEHLLEVVNPMMGLPEGRFCYTGPHRFREGYVRAEKLPGHQGAKKQILDILQQYPLLAKAHHYWKTPDGKKRYAENMRPSEMKKHTHNHKDWVYYSEE
jgi:arylsulfatase A-like enzyme